jgi:transcriptional regulator with GAF, ATPase, and Fis domain
VSLPLVVAGESIGALTFADLRHEREWPSLMVDRLRLIAQIVASALARKEADVALRRAHAFEALIAELSTTLAGIPTHTIDRHVDATLHRIGDFLGADRSSVFQAGPKGAFVRTHQWVREGWPPITEREETSAFPWLVDRLSRQRVPVVFARLDDLPAEAARDRESLARHGIKSGIARPLLLGDRAVGALVFVALGAPQRWPPELVDRLRLVSEVVAGALARHRAETELRTALAENEHLRARLEARNRYLQHEIREDHGFAEIVGKSARLRAILRQVDQVATTDVPVLLLGETGTGKELIARAIHARSGRGDQAFITVNCAALPPSLIESELFGHEKGAFTGATQTRVGRFELADGSTLFLDEIGDLEPSLQAKLLRVLQDGDIQRLGSSRTQKVDVRVLAATNRDLDRALRDGRFREDLYYRLSVFPITLPPLRERREDIPLLLWHCIESRQRVLGRAVTEVPPAVMDALVAYDWPGNVRELQNVVDRALILSTGSVLEIDSAFGVGRGGRAGPDRVVSSGTLEDVERAHIVRMLDECGWVLEGHGQAAERLGLRPSTLRHRMKALGIVRPPR